MKLLDYMKSHRIDDASFAKLVDEDTTARAVRKWKYGEATPPLPKLLRIQSITDGAVAPADFLRPESAEAAS